jgi:hypothetical protein
MKGLLNGGYAQSNVGECVYYSGSLIFMVYMDDEIFNCTHMRLIDQSTMDLRHDGYDIEDMGEISDYLGIIFRGYLKERSSCPSYA